MSYKPYLFLCAFLFLSSSVVSAGNSTKKDLPEGMEALPMGGGRRILMPRDTKSHKSGNVILLEGTNEYVTRKFTDLEKKLTNIETFQNALAKEIEEIKESIKKIEANITGLKSSQENRENEEKVGEKDLTK